MTLESKITDASITINQRFLMLVQALSGIRGLTSITIDHADEGVLLDKVLEVLNENLDFECCSIFLLNNNDELYCAAGKSSRENKEGNRQAEDKAKKTHVFKMGQGIIGQAAQSREIYHCQDCRKDSNYLSILNSQGSGGIGSLISMPVIVGDELLGVLNVSHPETNFFHPWQEHIISIHANILAQMLYNHRLMRDMATQVSNRTRELQISLEETESLKSKYQALSVIDDLTQIYNRRYFFTEVPAALARALRYNQPLSLLFIDLDFFKSINDKYGHDVGDRVLRDVAAVLSEQSRKGDILARMGGEEFAIAVPNTDLEGIQLLAKRISDSVAAQRWEHGDACISVTLSIGISELNPQEQGASGNLNRVNEMVHNLVREADEALYHCKESGRNTITFYRDLEALA